jgi:hypothetical protein
MTIKQRSLVLAVAFAGLFVGMVAWFATQPSTSTAAKPSAASVAGPQTNFGFSKAVQARIDQLNQELDTCLLANGAKRVALERGWTYTNPGGDPAAACAGVQARVNAYADSEEYRQAVEAVMPAVHAYSACLEREGAAATQGSPTAAQEVTHARAQLACGATPEDTVAGG